MVTLSASHVWNQHKVDNGHIQFFASAMVIGHLSKYKNWGMHKNRVMDILSKRQYSV